MRISLPHVMSTSVLLTFMVGAVVSLTSSVPPHPSLQPVIKAAVVTGNKELITTHAPARTFLTVSLMLIIHADEKTFPDNVQKRLFFVSKNFCRLKLPVQSISVIFVFPFWRWGASPFNWCFLWCLDEHPEFSFSFYLLRRHRNLRNLFIHISWNCLYASTISHFLIWGPGSVQTDFHW